MPTEVVAASSREVVKTYRTASGEVRALRGVTADLPNGAFIAVVGPSGSGKSSLLRLLAGMDRPTEGSLVVDGIHTENASARTLRRLRRSTVGYLFQRPSDNFLAHLTVWEHLAVARRLAHRPPPVHEVQLLSTLGIEGRADHLPSELSGGEQQRAAIAAVLVGGAGLVVADEPTAELDTTSARQVLDAVDALIEVGITFVVATHDRSVIRRAGSVIELDHGVRRTRRQGEGAQSSVTDHPTAGTTAPAEVADRGARWRAPDSTPRPEPDVPLVLEATDVTKSYRRGDEVVHALEGVGVSIRAGELVGLVGRSGSGKTTLLNVIAGWEHEDSGSVVRPGGNGRPPGWAELAVVPQKLGLLDELTVRENIEYPARLTGRREELRERIDELMESLGIAHLHARYPKETSLGEQQRAAVARALVLSPALLLADEPTGHQDRVSEGRVIDAFGRAAANGTCCLIATHNEALAPRLDRVLNMADGRLTDRT
ncbi:MAG: ATP-binding cassette domain-containing protein [Actinobacteria bacterium]|nr:ATP-binding cassette domain-containing protein [Actinomycetota bacterium]